MKKSVRLTIKGSLQPVFFNQYIKENAVKLGIRGYLRSLQDGRLEVFLEGNINAVNEMTALCKKGTGHTMIRGVEEKEERFQDFRDFKELKI